MAVNTINEVSIRSKVINQLKKQQYVGFMRNAANTRFSIAKNSMIQELDGHDVTKELLSDPKKYGQSKLISRGNLVTFIGFPDGSTAYGELREYIRFNTNMEPIPDVSNDRTKIYYEFKVSAPSITEINNSELFQTPDGWSSKGWVEIIEKGVGNAAYYLFSTLGFSESRSFFGLQKKKRVKKQARFTPMRYVSDILENFRGKFR